MAARDPITLMVEAVEARLRLFFKADRWFFEVVPDPLTVEEFQAVTASTPLLAVSFRQFNPQAPGERRFKGPLGLRLTIVVKNSGKRAARFLGDARGPGLFPATCAALSVLNGHTVAGLGTIFATATAQAYADGFADKGMAIATIDLDMLVSMPDVTGDIDAAPDFLRLLNHFDPDSPVPGEELQNVRP